MPQKLWRIDAIRSKYVEWMEDQFDINRPEDWYGITASQMESFGGRGIVRTLDGWMGVARWKYPDYPWDPDRWRSKIRFRAQSLFEKILRSIIPMETEVEINHVSNLMTYEHTSNGMQIDAWIPRYNLALELQAP
jgi:hypothetical protein